MPGFQESKCNPYAFHRYLHRIPIIVSIDTSARNLNLLRDDRWLGKASNRVFIHLLQQPLPGAVGPVYSTELPDFDEM
eukprot:gene17536-65615_t